MRNQLMRTQVDIAEIIERYSDMVYKIALSYTGNKTVAEDILQDVFIKYMTASTEFQGEEHRKAWMIRVTMNEAKKHFRSCWNKRKIPLEDIYSFEDQEKHEIFYAVMELPIQYRSIIHLYYYEELSVKEISRLTKMKENTVTSRLYRGRKLLKEILEVEYEFG
ncbi:MAG: polymerase subfamily sigma factor [Firmicutes bacterium]|nr:polymerase subfamily sigma factor [Bacillota bacterium]